MSKEFTPEDFEKLTGKMAETVENQEKNDKAIKETVASVESMSADLEVDRKRFAKQIDQMRHVLSVNHGGKSGADDFFNQMAKFVCGVYHHKATGKVPDWCKLDNGVAFDELITGEAEEQKTATNFVTTTDATAGYLVPDFMRPGIIELKDIYGSLYPRFTKTTVAPGVNLKVSKDAANPVAEWRSTQATTIPLEGTPMSFGSDTLNTDLLGCYIQIANELLTAPGVDFGAVASMRMVRSITRAIEKGVMQNEDGTSGPSDGILVDSGVTSQTAIATMTFALFVSFLQECVADNAYALEATSNAVVMTPFDILALASQAVGASELTGMLVWGDPRAGIPTKLLGYDVMAHPSAAITTTDYVVLGDLSNIILAESPSFAIDVNPYAGNSFIYNMSTLRVFQHYDWSIGQPGEFHKAVVTNA